MGELIPMLSRMEPFLGPEVTSMFRLMGEAEEVIAEEVAANPLQETVIQGSFCLLCPRMTLFSGRDPRLYRHHCRELIHREIAGQDTRLGTKAEVLATLSKTSLMANLVQSAHLLMENLMTEIFPDYDHPGEWVAQESWPGQVHEIYGKCQRQTIEPKRTRDQKRRSTNV